MADYDNRLARGATNGVARRCWPAHLYASGLQLHLVGLRDRRGGVVTAETPSRNLLQSGPDHNGVMAAAQYLGYIACSAAGDGAFPLLSHPEDELCHSPDDLLGLCAVMGLSLR